MASLTIYISDDQRELINKLPYNFNISEKLRGCLDQILAQAANKTTAGYPNLDSENTEYLKARRHAKKEAE